MIPRHPFLRTILATALSLPGLAAAQFADEFNETKLALDQTGEKGWFFFTGDGQATMEFRQDDGFASVLVDATQDHRNIWWALIKRDISKHVDLEKLAQPGTELRLSARVRTHAAPRRINLHVNTQQTTDFHSQLREFDLAETGRWYEVSFTTQDFAARPGDQVFAQLALMDWGLGKYQLDIDWYRVEVVEGAPPALGDPLEYHPPLADPEAFKEVVRAAHDAVVDRREPGASLGDWVALENGKGIPVLAVNGTLYPVLRFDFSKYRGNTVSGSGLLELTTHSVQRRAEKTKDFGEIRVVEILGGDAEWDQRTVTYESLLKGGRPEEVFNSQMIIDVPVNETAGGKTYATLSRPVLQRLLDGRTKGLVILPLGSIHAAFASSEGGASSAPTLRFNVEP